MSICLYIKHNKKKLTKSNYETETDNDEKN